MDITVSILALFVGYLIGSISVSRIVTRIASPNVDLTKVKMKDFGTNQDYDLTNVGATTASVVLGPKIGGLIGVLDILKAFLPTLAARLIFPEQPYFLFVGGGVVGGHIWTLYHRFRGGGGLSPALGVFLAIDPLGTLAANLIAMFLGFVVFRGIPGGHDAGYLADDPLVVDQQRALGVRALCFIGQPDAGTGHHPGRPPLYPGQGVWESGRGDGHGSHSHGAYDE